MNYELKDIKLLGYTTDFNSCDCCGKTNLRGTITILDLTHGSVFHFGTTCAIKADKYDSLDAALKAKKEILAEVRSIEKIKREAWVMRLKYNIPFEKVDLLADSYVAHMINEQTRTQKFNWAAWQ